MTRTSGLRSSTSTSGATRRCGTATCTVVSTAPTPGSPSTSRPRNSGAAGCSSRSRAATAVTRTPRRAVWASTGGIAFAAASGCYLVESNQGHFGDDMRILLSEPTVGAYRASAQSARYSWELAAEMYGSAPHHGYVFGGSGGSARCLLCLENCPDVWQGAVPYIMGHSTSWSLGFSVQAHAARVLGPQMAGVIDAVEPGGSGDPFDGLSTRQREALAAMYRAGFPRGAESSFGTSGYAGTFASHISALEKHDPTYIDDFWNVPRLHGCRRRARLRASSKRRPR